MYPTPPRGLVALSPLFVFLLLYLGTGLVAGDFYKMPITVAFLGTCVYAVLISRGNLEERLTLFSRGAGQPGLLLMLWIFMLAGAFAASARQMGAVDATVNLALQLLPEGLLPAGLFLAACFISISMGTSVGTVVALTPIAAGLADSTGANLPFLAGIVVGGAYFGDNLSFISDTTIVATRSQGCKMSDKFMVNVRIVVPAALVALVLYVCLGDEVQEPAKAASVEWLKVLPYLAVLCLAPAGMNVLTVLTLGVLLCGLIGLTSGGYDLFGWVAAIGEGIAEMGDLILVTLLAGGLMELIRHGGGIDYVLKALTRRIGGKRGAELTIAALVMLVNLCTANNTVAILTVGPLAKDIAERFGIDKRKSASLLDTFSCLSQSLLPYGAQLLMAAGLAGLSPADIIPHLYYPFLMGFAALGSILFRYPRKYS